MSVRMRKSTCNKLIKDWSEFQISLLQHLVLIQKVYDWDELSYNLKKDKETIKKIWKNIIYTKIKGREKIAGTQKWSKQEDQILINIAKNKTQPFCEVAEFLKDRSVHSIEARWKRIVSQFTAETSQSYSLSKDYIEEEFNDFDQIGPYQARKRTLLELGRQILRRNSLWSAAGL